MVSHHESQKPPLPPGTPTLGVYSTPVIRRDATRPSQCYLDLTFLDNSNKNGADGGMSVQDIDAIIFKNHYTSSITVCTQEDAASSSGSSSSMAGSSFIPILENRQLMPSPHYENGCQDWVTVHVSEFNKHYQAGKPLRIYLLQPSPVWNAYEIRHICAVGKSKNGAHVAPVADGGLPGKGAETEAVWRSRSLSSLIQADSRFLLLQNASRDTEKTAIEESYKDLLPGMDSSTLTPGGGGAGLGGAGGPAKPLKKKAKDKNAAKKAASGLGGLALAGGVRKEVELQHAEKDDDPGSDTDTVV